ncbi:MAG: hypothetical protein JW929_10925 [Anaerolineales bacterium]|nr:hypothetical protein [Anaerolineales bacterium]
MAVKSRLLSVTVFSVAMAWVEAAVVLYLRVLVDRLQPYQADPLPHFGGLGGAEIVREAATLAMLLAAGWLAGTSVRSRLAYSAFAFGVWDIFYYVFLIPLTGWPATFLDWDILFLIPLPWWGPVIAPVGVSALLIAGGMLTILIERSGRPACFAGWAWLPALTGIGLILYAFMADAIGALIRGTGSAWNILPDQFPWGLFLCGFLLMAVPVAGLAWRFIVILRISQPQGIGGTLGHPWEP